MRILVRKSRSGWQCRFPFGNPWDMPSGEWLPLAVKPDSTASRMTGNLEKMYPGCNVFTIVPVGKDLD